MYYLKEWCKNNCTSIAKLEGCEKLRQNFMFAEIFRVRVQILTQILEKLLFLCWLFNLKTQVDITP